MEVKGIQNVGLGQQKTQQNLAVGTGNTAFGRLLEEKSIEKKAKESQSLNFSKHAAKRLGERGIEMDCHLMGNLEHAVDEARKKGAKDVAVIGREGVFIVNVPNNVVVTTMTQEDMKNKIMTNIDSAVFM